MPIDKMLWPGTPATNSQIAEFEAAEGIKLPVDFRTFLKEHNGGRPIPDAFTIGPDNATLLDTFFQLGLGEDEPCDLQTMCDRYHGRIPADFIPVGADAGGNVVLLAVHGEAYGRVYFLDQMNPRPAFEIAPSFQAFLESFHRPAVSDARRDVPLPTQVRQLEEK